MADLKIRIYKRAETQPDTTITVPGAILNIAGRIIPKKAAAALQDKGVDLEELIKLSNNPDISGTILVVEEHKKQEKIVISLDP